jgi:hypothetical protein
MKSELKRKWVEALRSGKYEQGRLQLRTHDNKFCCLGVLCDIVDSSKWKPADVDDEYYNGYFYDGIREGSPLTYRILPDSLLEQVGCRMEAYLSNANDNHDTFEQIADYIEREV